METYKRLNRIFSCMKRRCYDAKNPSFNNYGARHITICKEWYTPGSHKGWLAFKSWAFSHGYQEGLTIDRIDNDKGYSPANCRWITYKEQANNRRSNHLITYKGETHNLSTWCELLNLNYDRIERRLNKCHWSVEKSFETDFVPPDKRRFV